MYIVAYLTIKVFLFLQLQKEVKDAQLIFKKLDLASLESIRECAKDINATESRLDILINNAGNNFLVCIHLMSLYMQEINFTTY